MIVNVIIYWSVGRIIPKHDGPKSGLAILGWVCQLVVSSFIEEAGNLWYLGREVDMLTVWRQIIVFISLDMWMYVSNCELLSGFLPHLVPCVYCRLCPVVHQVISSNIFSNARRFQPISLWIKRCNITVKESYSVCFLHCLLPFFCYAGSLFRSI